MSDNTLVNDSATGAEIDEQNQAETVAKTYTQDEVDNMMARMKGSITRKLESRYADLGDVDELRQLKIEAEKRQQEQQIKRGEFEKTLQDLATKKDEEIRKRDQIIQGYRLEQPLLNAAAKMKAVNPEQVQALLKNNLRLNEQGEAEVLDSSGAVRYDDAGVPLTVESYVQEWLQGNPHFLSAAPSTTNTKSNIGKSASNGKFDLASLDLTNPQHRQMYKEAKEKGLL